MTESIGKLTSNARPLGAYRKLDEVADLLDRFEDIHVECVGYDENGHRVWDIQVDD